MKKLLILLIFTSQFIGRVECAEGVSGGAAQLKAKNNNLTLDEAKAQAKGTIDNLSKHQIYALSDDFFEFKQSLFLMRSLDGIKKDLGSLEITQKETSDKISHIKNKTDKIIEYIQKHTESFLRIPSMKNLINIASHIESDEVKDEFWRYVESLLE